MQFVFLFINKLLTFLFCPITSASPVIPSDEDFQVIAELHPFLAKCQEYSEIWSSDKTPTVHKIQQHLFSLITMCHRTVTQNTSGKKYFFVILSILSIIINKLCNFDYLYIFFFSRFKNC